MAIENRNLAVGTKLWARYKNEVYNVEVVLSDEPGRVAYRLLLGGETKDYKSPSAAGAAVMGPNRTCNGWAFWTVGDPTEKPAKEPKAPKATKASGTGSVHPAPKPERKTRSRKPKSESEVPTDGNGHALPIVEQVDGSFECGECGASFPTTDEAAAHLSEVHPA